MDCRQQVQSWWGQQSKASALQEIPSLCSGGKSSARHAAAAAKCILAEGRGTAQAKIQVVTGGLSHNECDIMYVFAGTGFQEWHYRGIDLLYAIFSFTRTQNALRSGHSSNYPSKQQLIISTGASSSFTRLRLCNVVVVTKISACAPLAGLRLLSQFVLFPSLFLSRYIYSPMRIL